MAAVSFPNRNFMQICWLVHDIDTAIDSWVHSAGVGPFFRMDGIPFTGGRYRGRSAEFPAVTIAIAYAGEMQIELVRQDNDDPGVFRDLFSRGHSGLHHMALLCQDYATERSAYINSGAEIAFEGESNGGRVCYVDTSATLGFMVELLEASPVVVETFAVMRTRSRRWDGKNPTESF